MTYKSDDDALSDESQMKRNWWKTSYLLFWIIRVIGSWCWQVVSRCFHSCTFLNEDPTYSSLYSEDDFRSGCRDVSQNVTSNSPSRDCTHPDDHNLRTSLAVLPLTFCLFYYYYDFCYLFYRFVGSHERKKSVLHIKAKDITCLCCF